MFSKKTTVVRFRAIIEVMGRPAEFLTETLSKAAEKLEKEDNFQVLTKEIFEPKEIEDDKGLYSTFMEIELKANDIKKLFEFVLNYLPSNIEVLEPSEMVIPINEANSIMHDFIEKVHKNDSIAKKVGFENIYLKQQIQGILSKELNIQIEAPKENIEAKVEEKAKEKTEEKKEVKKSKKKK